MDHWPKTWLAVALILSASVTIDWLTGWGQNPETWVALAAGFALGRSSAWNEAKES